MSEGMLDPSWTPRSSPVDIVTLLMSIPKSTVDLPGDTQIGLGFETPTMALIVVSVSVTARKRFSMGAAKRAGRGAEDSQENDHEDAEGDHSSGDARPTGGGKSAVTGIVPLARWSMASKELPGERSNRPAMTATSATSDMGTGLAMAFGAFAAMAALASTASAYLYALDGDHGMQAASGVAIGAAMLFAGLAIVVLHRYGE